MVDGTAAGEAIASAIQCNEPASQQYRPASERTDRHRHIGLAHGRPSSA